MRKISMLFLCMLMLTLLHARETCSDVNGVADERAALTLSTSATICKGCAKQPFRMQHWWSATEKLLRLAPTLLRSKDAAVIDCKAEYVYPSFIDLFSDWHYPPKAGNGNRSVPGTSAIQKAPMAGTKHWNLRQMLPGSSHQMQAKPKTCAA